MTQHQEKEKKTNGWPTKKKEKEEKTNDSAINNSTDQRPLNKNEENFGVRRL